MKITKERMVNYLEKTLFWGVVFLIIFIPLYMKFPLARVAGTFVSIRLEDVIIFILLIILLMYLYITKQIRGIVNNTLYLTIGVFLLIGLFSSFSAVFLSGNSWHLVALHYLRRVELLLLLPLAIIALKKGGTKVILMSSFLVVLVVNIYAIGQRYLHFPVVSTTNSELSKGLVYYLGDADRVSSTFAGHYDLAIFLMMAVVVMTPIVIYVFENRADIIKTKPNLYRSLALVALYIFSLIILVMTAARLSFVSAIVGILVSPLVLNKKKIILLVILASLIVVSYPSKLRDRLVSTVTINISKTWKANFVGDKQQQERSKLNIPTLPSNYEKLDSNSSSESAAADIVPGEPTDLTDLGVYRSLEIRTKVEWPRAIRAFVKNPLFGTGYSSLGLATDSDLLRALGETGIIGTISFLLIIIEVTKRVWRAFKQSSGFARYYTAGIIAMVVAYLLNALVIDVFEASKVAAIFWLIVGATLSQVKDPAV